MFQIDDNPKTSRRTPFKVGFEPQCFVRDLGISITCKVVEIKGAEYVGPGETAELMIELSKPAMIIEQDAVFLRESNKSIGTGRITSLVGVQKVQMKKGK